ncbi:hypothetical protein MYX76_01905 [Desulfobacterota bacterium AH_259_B03_O07]|nr:hypothetical protein [Desulfobacterota bacterium AH_259_B03_O07]
MKLSHNSFNLKAFSPLLFVSLLFILLTSKSLLGIENFNKETNLIISDEEITKIGHLIFINECGGKIKNLTAWNEGEEFASFGIGHFIWYPKGIEGPFYETFPRLLNFIKNKGIKPPEWIENLPSLDLPWNSREMFINDFKSNKMNQLREFLVETIPYQTLFLVNRFQNTMPKLLITAPQDLHDHIKSQFYRVVNSPMGMYALIDYVNFKGEGTEPSERYKGEGWGLLQLLEDMQGTETGNKALVDFANAAEKVLVRRISNSPPERNEKRWLSGWEKRINTYIPK